MRKLRFAGSCKIAEDGSRLIIVKQVYWTKKSAPQECRADFYIQWDPMTGSWHKAWWYTSNNQEA